MKYFAAGSRLGLATILLATVTGCASLVPQKPFSDQAAEAGSIARAGSTITRYPVKMRRISSMPSLSAVSTN
ncbi:MAG: hypothetical protein ACPGSC_01170 [Granulosicoccaceae bacterium]